VANTIVLPEKFTPDAIATILDQVPLPLVDLSVDGSSVRQLSTPGLQVLLTLAKSLKEAGLRFQLVNTSDAMAEDLLVLGLSNTETLGDVV